ncbi:MAG: DEAD/DEAH box helicase family protein [Acidobacteriia bacterium]|nr:DEAD/DEAH box helicase family protein [Terriglobia bacterium]
MDLNEAETRRRLIDEDLRLAGWVLDDPSQVIQELDIVVGDTERARVAEPESPYAGHQFADYGLLMHGKPIAVVEAKRTSKDAELGREQALRYATNLQRIHGGPLPFILYTNGYQTFLWEHGFYPPVQVHGFPTPDDLEWMDRRREGRKPLSVELIDTKISGRDYQIAAIRAVLEALEAKRTKLLLVMATGTGKTRVAVSLIDVLFRARWAKRVLFLVDRIALRDQALAAFKEFMPSEPAWPQEGDRSFVRGRRVYVTTYPTMLNLIQGSESPSAWISPHYFDVVIADESHRSIYNIYQQTLGYFHAIKIGLTATPTDRIDHDTFELFDCETYDPTFAYTYEEAIAHQPPYLCDFEVLKVRSKFQIEGIQGGALPPQVQSRLVAEGKDLDDIDFEGTDLERKVTNSGTNALIVREFMEECIKDPSGVLPGKTIVFAISKGHARRLEALFDRLYPEHAGRLARVLVSDDRFVYGKGGLLEQFKTQEMPRVAISVDLLDTGVDVRELVNLVFAKPVYSYVKFWQMIGRGTRVLEVDPAKRRPWCPEKDRFLIIDCWGNFEYFKMNPKGREPEQQAALPVRLFRARIEKLEAAVTAGRADIAELVKADLRADLAGLPRNNVVVKEAASDLATVRDDQFWEHLGAEGLVFLRTVIAPVLRARSEADFKALRFETEVVELGTALLQDNREAFEAIRDSVVLQVSELPLSVNLVARQRDLIEAVQGPAWWAQPTDGKLRELARRLAPLMRFRQRRSEPMMKLDIADLLATKEWVEVGPEHERMTSSAYRARVEAYVQELVASNPLVARIKAGEAVSDEEIHQLADLLERHDPHITVQLLRKVYNHRGADFVRLLRHVLGVERLELWPETVTQAFDAFIAAHTTLGGLQLQFLQTLKTFILQTGRLAKEDLVQPPFTQLHPRGIRGVFKPAEIEEVMRLAERLVA